MIRLLLLCLGLPTLVAADPLPRPIVSEILTADSLAARHFTGVIAAEHQTSLAFQTAGRIARLDLSIGDRVAKGQTLAELDRITLDEDVAAAKAALSAAEAALTLAEASLTRTEALAAKGVAPDVSREAAQEARDQAQAQAEKARADLRRAEDAARFGSLIAPEAGVVLAIAVQPGTVVSAVTPVLTLALGPEREAILDLPADLLPLLAPDQPFTLTSRIPEAAPLTGHLRLVEPVADATVRARRIRVSLPEAPDFWRIGALVRAEMARSGPPVITLPPEAILKDPPRVWVVGRERKVHATPVTLGALIGLRQAVEGLQPGQEVVLRGIHSLTEGQIVGDRE
jgi:RND family efflux transporter MFP subunit